MVVARLTLHAAHCFFFFFQLNNKAKEKAKSCIPQRKEQQQRQKEQPKAMLHNKSYTIKARNQGVLKHVFYVFVI